MATFTVNSTDAPKANRLLDTISVTDASATTATSKAVPVPQWATSALWLLSVTTMAGTSPLIDFTLKGVNPWSLDTTHTWNLGDWDGITQLTSAASPVMVAIDVGPGITADDTGSATASCRYGVEASLPPMIVYTHTYDGTTQDEDYAYTISVFFK